MKDRAGQNGTKAGHVPIVPLTETGQDGTHSYRVSRMSRLSRMLQSIHSLDELYGFANRRKVLGCADDKIAPKWTDEERQLILARKYELERRSK